MRISILLAGLSIAAAVPASAAEMGAMTPEEMKQEHGGQIFHMFRLEADSGADADHSVSSWDLDGWIGGDENKLWLKSEGEYVGGEMEQAEIWALYSRNIATFWDAQVGVRYDFEPDGTAYLAAGFEGLAPYYFETEAHFFVSEDGDLSARIREENDFLLTQKLILQPYIEVELSAQDVAEKDIGAGVTEGQIGLQTRWEFTRKFAPYVDIRYGRKFGETASIANNNGEGAGGFTGLLGLRLMY